MLNKLLIHRIFRIPFKTDSKITLGKDPLDKFDISDVIYKLTCKTCDMIYLGETS